MASHVSVTAHQTPHINRTTRTTAIFNVLKQRAQAILNDTSIDAQSRAIIRYGLETNDPWLAELVDRTDAGENIADSFDFSQTANFSQTVANDDSSSKEEIEALAEMICQGGDQSAAALLVLMGTLANSANPRALGKVAKHVALTRCGELNVYGLADVQIAAVRSELFSTRGTKNVTT